MSLIKKVINKGYTLEITSWENDGDYYRTKTKTVETKEEAKMLYDICTTLFKSCNNGEGGIGNSMDREELETVLEYYESNTDVLTIEPFIDLKSRINDDDAEDLIFDCFLEIAYDLMGNSEYYDCRVCESVIVTFSPEDIYLEEIKF